MKKVLLIVSYILFCLSLNTGIYSSSLQVLDDGSIVSGNYKSYDGSIFIISKDYKNIKKIPVSDDNDINESDSPIFYNLSFVNPKDPNNMYAIIYIHLLGPNTISFYYTDDHGKSWSKIEPKNESNKSFPYQMEINVDPLNFNKIYLIDRSTGSLMVSDNGGFNARSITKSLDGYFNYLKVYNLFINPTNSQNLLITTDSGLHKSHNYGESWDRVNASKKLRQVKQDINNVNIIYAITKDNKLLKSIDGGSRFQELDLVDANALNLFLDINTGKIFVETETSLDQEIGLLEIDSETGDLQQFIPYKKDKKYIMGIASNKIEPNKLYVSDEDNNITVYDIAKKTVIDKINLNKLLKD